jgi:hypothetical protein
MSLLKKPHMTENKVAANRRNQKLCHGAMSAEGRQRIRAAHLHHGYYVKAEEVALRSLGEDPAQFDKLLEGLWNDFSPAGSLQEGLVIRLARAMWLMNRTDRMQEGLAVRQANDVGVGRENRMHAQMMRLTMTAETLRLLARSVSRKYYVTPLADLETMKNLHEEGVLKEMGEIALALFYRLQAPGTGEDGVDSNEAQRRVLARIKDIFGISDDAPRVRESDSRQAEESAPQADDDTDDAEESQEDAQTVALARYPQITEAEWKARERARQLLENILTRQAEFCETQRKAILKESLMGPSPYERAAEIAPLQGHAQPMRRLQDSYFREVRRITNLLLKVQGRECPMEPSKETEGAPAFHDILENKDT